MFDTDRLLLEAASLFWTAGFLEGEGSFGTVWTMGGTPRIKRLYPMIQASQVAYGPIQRLKELYGGCVCLNHPPSAKRLRHSPIWHWSFRGRAALRLMQMVYPLMCSRRREQIDRVLEQISRGSRTAPETVKET